MLLLYSYLLLEKQKACPDKENVKSAHVKHKYKIKRTKNPKDALMVVTFCINQMQQTRKPVGVLDDKGEEQHAW